MKRLLIHNNKFMLMLKKTIMEVLKLFQLRMGIYKTISDSRAPCVQRRPSLMTEYEIRRIHRLKDPITHFSLFSDFDRTIFYSALKDETWRKAVNDEIAAIE